MSKQAGPSKEKPKSITINLSGSNPVTETEKPREPKQLHICIFGDCKKGKRGGTDYCRTHKPLSVKQTSATSTKNNYNKSTKQTSTKSTKNNSKKSSKKTTPVEKNVIIFDNPSKNPIPGVIIGITMMLIGPLTAYEKTIFDSDGCFYYMFCFFMQFIGFSIFVTSFHINEEKISKGMQLFWGLVFTSIILWASPALMLWLR